MRSSVPASGRGRSGRRPLAPLLGLALLLPAAAAAAAQTAPPPATAASDRPTIGLVLSGGVARGLAHLGVIETLEEMGVPIDLVTGTSMGALVGGLYASGYSPEELRPLASDLPLLDLFTDRVERRLLPPGARLLDSRTIFSYPVRGQRIGLPIGALRGESIMRLLQRLTWPVQNRTDFSRLPLPFAAIATDLETGEAVVLTSGSLAEAMRASISMPGIFEPVRVNGRLLVDGGFARNLPSEDARALGADILVCSDVASELEPEEELRTMVDVVMQTVTLHLRARSEAQRRLCDVVIRPDVSGLSGASFDQVDRWIARGREATLQKDSVLRGLVANSRRRRPPTEPLLPPELRLDRVEVHGTDSERARRVALRALSLPLGEPVGPDLVDAGVARLYGTNLFSRATYRVETSGADTTLVFDVTEQPTDYLGFGLRYDDHRHVSLLLAGTMRNWLSYGSTLQLDLRLGEQLQLGATHLVAPGLLSPWGHSLDAEYTRALFDLYEGDRRTGETHAEVVSAGAAAGISLGEAAVAGVRLGVEWVEARPTLSPVDAAQRRSYASATFHLLRNTLDHRGFPTRGVLLRAESGWAEGVAGADAGYGEHLLEVERVLPLGGALVLRAHAMAGGATGGDLPVHRRFYLGGAYPSVVFGETQAAFWGLHTQERQGRAIQAFRLSLQKDLGMGVFATAGVNAGNTFTGWEMSTSDYLVGWGAALGASTPIGPVEVTLHGRELDRRPLLDLNAGLSF